MSCAALCLRIIVPLCRAKVRHTADTFWSADRPRHSLGGSAVFGPFGTLPLLSHPTFAARPYKPGKTPSMVIWVLKRETIHGTKAFHPQRHP
jgi:hypothetical protein